MCLVYVCCVCYWLFVLCVCCLFVGLVGWLLLLFGRLVGCVLVFVIVLCVCVFLFCVCVALFCLFVMFVCVCSFVSVIVRVFV